MSADLSRRLARLKLFPPIRDLTPEERRALFRAIHVARGFDQLSPRFKDVIIAAEAERERLRSAQQAVAEAHTPEMRVSSAGGRPVQSS